MCSYGSNSLVFQPRTALSILTNYWVFSAIHLHQALLKKTYQPTILNNYITPYETKSWKQWASQPEQAPRVDNASIQTIMIRGATRTGCHVNSAAGAEDQNVRANTLNDDRHVENRKHWIHTAPQGQTPPSTRWVGWDWVFWTTSRQN